MAEAFFQATAWTMDTPKPYGAFHLVLTVLGVSLSIFLARKFSFPERKAGPDTILFLCGLFLGLTELYKQGFIYYIRNVFYLFIQDFGLLGGIMALAEPSGLMHPYWTMTVHGFLWHFNLIFMGLICAFYNLKTETPKSYLHTIPLFLFCTAIATAVNVLSHPYGNADMFYISPYYPNGQIVFHQISLVIGTFAGNCLYLASVLLGGFIIHISCLEIGQHYFTKISKF